MNPPTKGHEILISGMLELAKLGNAAHILYLSHSQNNLTDPLAFTLKRRIVTAAFPDVKVSNSKVILNPFDALRQLSTEYEDIVFLVGSDRVEEFTKNMPQYAAKWGVKNFAVMSGGHRDPDAKDATGMSASKLRTLAKASKQREFCKGLPNQLNSVMKTQVYQYTIKGLENARSRNITVKRAKR